MWIKSLIRFIGYASAAEHIKNNKRLFLSKEKKNVILIYKNKITWFFKEHLISYINSGQKTTFVLNSNLQELNTITDVAITVNFKNTQLRST